MATPWVIVGTCRVIVGTCRVIAGSCRVIAGGCRVMPAYWGCRRHDRPARKSLLGVADVRERKRTAHRNHTV